jgi:hypothetical protein
MNLQSTKERDAITAPWQLTIKMTNVRKGYGPFAADHWHGLRANSLSRYLEAGGGNRTRIISLEG